jgi:hypothetical protein
VLEERRAGEELKICTKDPALAHPFIGQSVNMLEHQQASHETGLDPPPVLRALERRGLLVEPVPIDPAGELNQRVLHVDDLIEPRPKQIAFARRLVLLRPHRSLQCTTKSWFAAKGNPKTKLQASNTPRIKILQSQNSNPGQLRFSLNRVVILDAQPTKGLSFRDVFRSPRLTRAAGHQDPT